MSYSNLSTELQNLVMTNHDYFTKWFVFLTIVGLSSYYLFGVWKTHKPTIYFTQAILRFFLYVLSIVYLFSSPLLLLLMTPEYSFLEFYRLPLIFYSIIAAITMVVLFVDMIRYGGLTMLKLAGLDTGDPAVRDIANQIQNNKHFFGKKLFKFGSK